MGDEINSSVYSETDILAHKLSDAVAKSEEYIIYRQCLDEIKKDPGLYAQVNELRRNNFQRQNGGGRMSHEEYYSFMTESRRLRSNPLVNRFLDAEVGLGRLLQTINKIIISRIEFDTDFLE